MKDSKSVVFSNVDEVGVEEVDRAEGIYVEWLVGEESASDCYMRRFTMKKGGMMPLHEHDNLYHVQYVLKGKIKVTVGDEEYVVEKGSFTFIPTGIPHAYENLSDGESEFLCIIPAIGDRHTEVLED